MEILPKCKKGHWHIDGLKPEHLQFFSQGSEVIVESISLSVLYSFLLCLPPLSHSPLALYA